jgi:hypothetical protein
LALRAHDSCFEPKSKHEPSVQRGQPLLVLCGWLADAGADDRSSGRAAAPPTGEVEFSSPALEAPRRAPRLLQRSFPARKDFPHALIDTDEGVMRHVTNCRDMLGAH